MRKFNSLFHPFITVMLALFISMGIVRGQSVAQTAEQFFTVRSLAWSPDGTKIAVGRGLSSGQCDLNNAGGYVVQILDAETLAMLKELVGHTCQIISIAWNPDSDSLITGSSDGTLRLWDIAAGTSLFQTPITTFGAKTSLAWRFDGIQFMTVDSATHALEMYDAAEFQQIDFLPAAFDAYITSAIWSPDGNKLLMTTGVGLVIIWDATTGEEIAQIDDNHISGLDQAVWSADGTQIITSGRDLTLNIWDTVSAQKLMSLPFEYDLYTLAAGNDTYAATTHTDKALRLWNTQTGEMLAAVSYNDPIYAIAWQPGKPCLALGRSSYTPPETGIFVYCLNNDDKAAS